MGRPSWDHYFLRLAKVISERSTCIRRAVGAVLVLDKRAVSMGFNGAPQGLSHCGDIGCLREKMKIPSGERHELCSGVHAEQNAIIQAARYGVPIIGATLYCTTFPCSQCAKMLVNCGIKQVVFSESYPDPSGEMILMAAGIEIVSLSL